MRTWFSTIASSLMLLSWTSLGALGFARAPATAADQTGEQIFKQRCTKCHGPSGEGTEDEYPHPLAGERTVAQLSRVIAKTMPKDAAEKCSAADAEKVASYIYDTFYSRAARERNRPPRFELARLTVRQYRNAVADLIGSFRTPGRWDEQRGLKAVYFKSFGFRPKNQAFERVDPAVRFDFGEASPEPKDIEADRFSIRWEGSILAPETGEYEFTVRTEHGAKLWINDGKRPLIDAFVKSGDNTTEHRGSIFLLAGRAYPLRLEFAKGKQGEVDNKKKDQPKPPPVKASVALEWKLPGRAAEVVPSRVLSPNKAPETFVIATPFPPDDRSLGYERGTSISKAWDQATTDAAVEAAGYVAGHLNELAGIQDDAADREAQVREFCKRFAERGFRRPLSAEEQKFFVDRRFEGDGSLETKFKRVVLLVLKSPRFLYREAAGGTDAFAVASRLSFALWDSLPDTQLLEAAAKGQLSTREQAAKQAERMLSDVRARAKLREFFMQWLKVDQPPDLAKDPKQFPGFDQAVTSDLRTSLELFLEDELWSEASDFRRLLSADYLYLNGRLSKFYGGDLPADAPFQKVASKPGERAGVLSHPYLMATFAYTGSSSPIHRGVFLARNVLGQVLRPPPEAFAPLAAELHPELTTRERVALQTKPQACQSCHGVINPLGFTLENFDALGRYRDKEKDRPIDPKGAYQTRAGKVVSFAGLRDLAAFLAGTEETHEAFVERMFHYLMKQPIRALGPQKPAELRRGFADHQFNMRKLAAAIAVEAALAGPDEKRETAGPRGKESASHSS
jgi:mono/diheme cytochrome c family protein